MEIKNKRGVTVDISTVSQLIGSLGFPIAACCAMGWYCIRSQNQIKEINEQHREEIKEINEKHSEDIQKMTEAVNNNTVALQKLCDRLRSDTDE